MYFSLFSSSKYYSDENVNMDVYINDEDLCLICLLPGYKKNEIKLLIII